MGNWEDEKKRRAEEADLRKQSMGDDVYKRDLLCQNFPSLWEILSDCFATGIAELNRLSPPKQFEMKFDGDLERLPPLRLLVSNAYPKTDLLVEVDLLGFAIKRTYTTFSDQEDKGKVESAHKINLTVEGAKIFIWDYSDGPRKSIQIRDLGKLLLTGFSLRNRD